ncbi:MAG: dihydroorotase [Thermomicrobiales bacterium]
MTTMLIRGGRVIDPANGLDSRLDVRVSDGKIFAIAAGLEPIAREVVIDADGCLVTPGWIDAHVHLRDPGPTYKEDLVTGAAAAAAGGFTRVCCMPNTSPSLDTPERIADIVERGRQTGIHIHPIGAISVGREGGVLAPLREMAAAGAIGFSDDGDSAGSEDVMREALRLTSELNLPIMVHCEDPELARGGSMHRGAVSEELGDPGIPAEAEESYIERDLRLAEETGGWLHVLHVSTVRGIELIQAARARGVRVTAEVMPHHLLMTDEWVAGRRRFAGELEPVGSGPSPDSSAKVNPPLRPESDALGLIQALRRGAFDFVATDHAPHAERDKPASLSSAAFGMTALELALPTMARLVERGDLDWPRVVELLTAAPARTLGLPGGALGVGDPADITVIDPRREWVASEETLRSRSKNTPLLGTILRGRALLTICDGEVRHDARA